MRDRDYPTAKPPGTFRIALVGDSIAAGWGVDDGEGFEPSLERRAGRAVAARRAGRRSRSSTSPCPGHGPGQRWEHFARVGWAMRPRPGRLRGDPGRPRLGRAPAPRPAAARGRLRLAALPRRPGRARGRGRAATPETYKARAPAATAGRSWRASTGRSSADCRARGVPVVWVLIPRVGKPADPAERAPADRAGAGRGVRARSSTCPTPTTGSTRPRWRSARRLPPQRRGPRPAGPPARRRPWLACPDCAGCWPEPSPGADRPSDRPCPRRAASALCFALTLLVLAARPGPAARRLGRRGRSLDSARSPEPNRADREANRRRLLREPDRRRRPRRGLGRARPAAAGQARPTGSGSTRRTSSADPRRRLPPVRARARTRTRPSSASRSPPTPTACAAGRRAREKPEGTFRIAVLGLVDGHGLGRRHRRDVRQPARGLAQRPRRAGGAWPGGSRCSTSPSPPTARSSGSSRSAARRSRSSPTW